MKLSPFLVIYLYRIAATQILNLAIKYKKKKLFGGSIKEWSIIWYYSHNVINRKILKFISIGWNYAIIWFNEGCPVWMHACVNKTLNVCVSKKEQHYNISFSIFINTYWDDWGEMELYFLDAPNSIGT